MAIVILGRLWYIVLNRLRNGTTCYWKRRYSPGLRLLVMIVACFNQTFVALYIVAARTWLLGAGMSDRRVRDSQCTRKMTPNDCASEILRRLKNGH